MKLGNVLLTKLLILTLGLFSQAPSEHGFVVINNSDYLTFYFMYSATEDPTNFHFSLPFTSEVQMVRTQNTKIRPRKSRSFRLDPFTHSIAPGYFRVYLLEKWGGIYTYISVTADPIHYPKRSKINIYDKYIEVSFLDRDKEEVIIRYDFQ